MFGQFRDNMDNMMGGGKRGGEGGGMKDRMGDRMGMGGNRRLMDDMGIGNMMGGMMNNLGDGGMMNIGDLMGGMDMDGKMGGAVDAVRNGMNKMGGKSMGMMKALKRCMCEQCEREESCAGLPEESEEGDDCEANKYVVMRTGAKNDKKGKKAVTKKTKKIAKALKKWQKAVDKAMKKGKKSEEEIKAAADEKSFKKLDMA